MTRNFSGTSHEMASRRAAIGVWASSTSAVVRAARSATPPHRLLDVSGASLLFADGSGHGCDYFHPARKQATSGGLPARQRATGFSGTVFATVRCNIWQAAGCVRKFGQASMPSHRTQAHETGSGEQARDEDAAPFDMQAMEAWGTLNPLLKHAVIKIGLKEPTEIQRLSLGKNVEAKWRDSLMLAETGSGKTLAYLLPTLHRLKEVEDMTATRARPRRPRVLVIVPTRELGEQVLAVAKSISHAAKFSAAGAFGGGSRAEQGLTLARGCDMLVATPLRLVSLAEEGLVYFGDVRAIAVDEADTILAQGFRQELEQILVPVRAAAAHAAQLNKQWRDQIAQGKLSKEDQQRASARRGTPFHLEDNGVNRRPKNIPQKAEDTHGLQKSSDAFLNQHCERDRCLCRYTCLFLQGTGRNMQKRAIC